MDRIVIKLSGPHPGIECLTYFFSFQYDSFVNLTPKDILLLGKMQLPGIDISHY